MATSKITNTEGIATSQITTGAGTNIRIDLCKNNKSVMLLFAGGGYTADANETLATVPEGFRPYNAVDYKDVLTNHRISILTNGKITCSEALSNQALRGSVTYICQ